MHAKRKDEEMKGSYIAIECLKRAGVEVIFAYPGGTSMELHQAMRDSGIRVILPRHEQGGAFAAAAFARATGKTGVCMATSGPGATNLLTGITDAYMDSIPLVAITGQVPSTLIGKNAFQETDIIGMTRPICKHSYLVLDASELPAIFAEAFHIANSGRPGPVLIDIPKNIQQQLCVPVFPARHIPRAYHQSQRHATESEIAKIRDAISHCERPCIYAGGGVIASGASRELAKFAESYNIPVVTSFMGIGAFPEEHPLSLKWLGMHGTVYANRAANLSDLLIAVGARFSDRVTGPAASFAKGARIVHIDIDPSEINKNIVADIGVVADAREVLGKLNKAPLRRAYKAWHSQIAEWRREFPLRYANDGKLHTPFVIERLYEITKGDAIIVTGVGQHQMWAGQYYNFKRPRQFISSGGLGAMGFGLPSSMGVKVACPDELVVEIDGDGSFQMNIQELGTIHAEQIGVKMMIMNNQHLGMVAQWEDRFYGSRRGNTDMRNSRVARPYPDFIKIAEGYGIPGREVYRMDEVEDAIREMIATDGPYLLDIHVAYQEHVLPMIPPGKNHTDIIVE